MSYDADAAWEKYKLRAADQIMKSSLEGKLDTIAQALNEVLANTERTATILPQLAGDDNAIDSAGDSFDPMAGGSPDMGTGDEDYMVGDSEGGTMPEDVGEMPAGGEGGTPPMMEPEEDMNKSEDMEDDFAPDATPGAEDMSAPEDDMGDDIPMDDGVDDSFSEGLDDDVVDDFGDESMDDMGAEPESGINGTDDTYQMLMDTLKEAAHRAIDDGRMEEVGKLAEVQSSIESIMGEGDMGDSIDSYEGDDLGDDMEPMEKSLKDVKNKVKGAVQNHKNKKLLKKVGAPEHPKDSDYGTFEYDPSDDEDDVEPMEKSCDVEKSGDKIAAADAPPMKKDVVNPGNTKQKVDHPIDVPSESGRNKGGVAGALDNVAKSADEPLDEVEDGRSLKKSAGDSKADEGEHEEEYTEYEDTNTAPTANTANTASLGIDTQKEHETALFKSNRDSVPSMRDFMGNAGTFDLAIDNLRKSSDRLGTELVMKHGMGCTGGIMGVINQQNAIRKAAVPLDEDVGEPEEDMMANEGMGDEINEPIDDVDSPEDNTMLEDDSNDLYDLSDLDGLDDGLDDLESDFVSADELEDDDGFDDTGSITDEPVEEPMDDGEIMDDDVEGEDEDLIDDSDSFKSEDSPDMPVEGMENIEASAGNPEIPSDGTNGAINKSGKHMTSFKEMMDSAIMKSIESRPPCTTSVGGDVRRPTLDNNIQKSATANKKKVRMGYGVNPSAVTADMWDEYNLYKSKPEL